MSGTASQLKKINSKIRIQCFMHVSCAVRAHAHMHVPNIINIYWYKLKLSSNFNTQTNKRTTTKYIRIKTYWQSWLCYKKSEATLDDPETISFYLINFKSTQDSYLINYTRKLEQKVRAEKLMLLLFVPVSWYSLECTYSSH